jgi:hypothetical protein
VTVGPAQPGLMGVAGGQDLRRAQLAARRRPRGLEAGVRLVVLIWARGAVGCQGVLQAAAEEGCQDPE